MFYLTVSYCAQEFLFLGDKIEANGLLENDTGNDIYLEPRSMPDSMDPSLVSGVKIVTLKRELPFFFDENLATDLLCESNYFFRNTSNFIFLSLLLATGNEDNNGRNPNVLWPFLYEKQYCIGSDGQERFRFRKKIAVVVISIFHLHSFILTNFFFKLIDST